MMTTLEPILETVQGSRQQWTARNTDQTVDTTWLPPIGGSSGKRNSCFGSQSMSCQKARGVGCGPRERTRCPLSTRASARASRLRSMTRSSRTHRDLITSKQPTRFTPPGPAPLPLTPPLTGPAAFSSVLTNEAYAQPSRAWRKSSLRFLSFSDGGLRASTYSAETHSLTTNTGMYQYESNHCNRGNRGLHDLQSSDLRPG